MLNPLQVIPIALGQAFAPQTLNRTPEEFGDSAVMDDLESVDQYNDAMQSKLSIVYAGALERIHRVRRRVNGGRAIDLCCGPGHFTLLLAKYFDYDEIIGVDLSEPMVNAANRNAKEWGLGDRVRFEVADATSYPAQNGSFDLVTCNDAAHHLPDLRTVENLVEEMDRLSSDNGIALLTDLVRLKSSKLTNSYTDLIGKDYLEEGKFRFQEDFCNSMQAAWTGDELQSSLPNRSSKHWEHKVQKVLPTVQFVMGYPKDDQPKMIRKGFPWSADSDNPVPKALRADWRMFRKLL